MIKQEAVQAMECPCGDATKEEARFYQDVVVEVEAVSVLVIGTIGLICNLAAIPTLLSR